MKAKLALIAILGLTPIVQAQMTPRTPPTPAEMAQHEVQHYTTLLSLTPAQAEQATTFFPADATARQTAHTTQRTAHQAMEAAIKANDVATIQSTATSLAQTESEVMVAHATARAQLYAILTADQKAKLTELESEHMEGGPMHGMGMGPR